MLYLQYEDMVTLNQRFLFNSSKITLHHDGVYERVSLNFKGFEKFVTFEEITNDDIKIKEVPYYYYLLNFLFLAASIFFLPYFVSGVTEFQQRAAIFFFDVASFIAFLGYNFSKTSILHAVKTKSDYNLVFLNDIFHRRTKDRFLRVVMRRRNFVLKEKYYKRFEEDSNESFEARLKWLLENRIINHLEYEVKTGKTSEI